MPDPVALGYASWDPRGYYHYHERPGGAFISKERYMELIKPSTAGYHGYGGEFQPYAAIAQIMGFGLPTTAHKWWRGVSEIAPPLTDIARRGATQYMVTVTAMRPDGSMVKERLFTPIGGGFDVGAMESQVSTFLGTGDKYGIEELPEDEQLWEIDRTYTQLTWSATRGSLPREEW